MPPRTRAATQSSAAAAPEAPAAKRAASRPNAAPATKSTPAPDKGAAAKAAVAKTPSKASPPAVKAPAAKRAAAVKEPAPAKAAVAKAPAPAKAAVAKDSATTARPVAKAAAPRPKAAPDKKAVSAGYVADERFLEHQKVFLGEERATYLEQARNLRAEAESLVEEMEPGDIQFDEESGEGGTVTVDRERDLALSAQALLAVEEIDDALHKIVTGRYGICEGCGELIPKARLEALPYARLCIACKNGGLSRR